MSDVLASVHEDIPVVVADQPSVTAGAMLRSAREAAGLHVAALAVSMKIPVKKLEALESNRFDLLPDAVFVRALAASVCRTLKIDSTPVLAKLPISNVPRLNTDERGINAPFHVSGHSQSSNIPAFILRPSVLAVIGLLIGVLALIFLPDFQISDSNKNIASAIDNVAVVPVLVAPMPPSPVEVVTTLNTPASAAMSEAVMNTPISPTAAVTPTVLQGAIVPATLLKEKSDLLVVESNSQIANLLAFKAKGPSWIEVVDSKGTVLLRKTLLSGEVVGLSGTPPFAVVIGRADAIDVDVRGKSFSLVGIAIDNVARFEVK
jgi:cytoskeleton protein RodZ